MNDLGQAFGLLQVQAIGAARGHRAVMTAPGADIAQYHEGGGAPVPTFADVGAVSLFADRVELLALHQVLELKIAGTARHLDLEPFGQAGPDLQFVGALGHWVSGWGILG